MDRRTLLVLTEAESGEIRSYLWPLAGGPLRAQEAVRGYLRVGPRKFAASTERASSGQAWHEVSDCLKFVALWPVPQRSRAVLPRALPAGVLFADFGPRRNPESTLFTGNIALYNAHGAPVARAGRPPDILVCYGLAPCYSAVHAADGYHLAVTTVPRGDMAAAERGATDLSLFRFSPSGKGIAGRRTIRRQSPLLKDTAEDPGWQAEWPALSARRGVCLFRRWGGAMSGADQVALAELWCVGLHGGEPRLLDAMAWYGGPRDGILSVGEDGRLKDLSADALTLDPKGCMVPAISPDGTKVAYIKGEAICIRELGR